MSGLFASRGNMLDLMSGRVSVIASVALAGLQQLVLDGVDLWTAEPAETGVLLTRRGNDEDGPIIPLDLPPSGTILLVSHFEGEFAALRRWWLAKSGRSVPEIVAADAEGALIPVLKHLSMELQALNSRCVQLERNLTETRTDYEESRTIIASVARTLGHRPPSQPTLEMATEPSESQVTAPGGKTRLLVRQRLGRKLDGLATIAFHISNIQDSSVTTLRVRLFGEESRRIFGSWKVLLKGRQVGWLPLDLPTPLGPERETALLEVASDVAADGLSLSLEQAWVPTEAACTVEGAELGERALALRIWTAAIGERFVLPAFWDWDEAGSSLPLLGVPQLLSKPEWDLARVLSGEFSSAVVGVEPARMVARLGSRQNAALLLPVVTIWGTDVLRLRCTVRAGDPGHIQFAAWILERNTVVESLEDLAVINVGTRFSGWRSFHNAREAELTMTLPVEIGKQAKVVLGVREQRAEADALIEFSELSFLATCEPAELRAKQSIAHVPTPQAEAARKLPGLSVPSGVQSVPVFSSLKLNQHFVGQLGYQHLDVSVSSLAGHGHHWPKFRFKIALTDHGPLLELRRAKGWPDSFMQWPGTQTDHFGPVVRVSPKTMGNFLGSLSHPKDLALATSLLQILSIVVSQTTQLAHLEDASDTWLDAADAIANAGEAALQKTAA